MAHAYEASPRWDIEQEKPADDGGAPALQRPSTLGIDPTLQADWASMPHSEFVSALRISRRRSMEEIASWVAAAGPESGLHASRHYAGVLDELIRVVFERARAQFPQAPSIAIASVGSYARKTLSLSSDVDIRVLVAGKAEQARETTEAMIYPLWDSGIDVGHQVIEADGPLDDAQHDMPTATSLLDWRYLVGDRQLSEKFQQRVFTEAFSRNHTTHLIEELSAGAEARRERYGSSVFLLEPDIKNGAGGLRDLDVLQWVARARWRVSAVSELVGVGVLLPGEGESLALALDFLVKVRNCLHRGQRRRIDRLGFVEQRAVAEALGYADSISTEDGVDSAVGAVEAFMSEYYRHAQEIERLSTQVLRRAIPPTRRDVSEEEVAEQLVRVNDKLRIVDPDRLFTEPNLALRCYQKSVELKIEVDEPTRRAISRACSSDAFCAQLRVDPDAAPAFRQLLAWPAVTAFRGDSIVRELHEVGLLVAMIPEFEAILGRVQHDAHHVYTVDVHSMVAVDVLRRLFRDEQGEHTHARAVALGLQRRELVALATLLHDIGKTIEGRKHAERGADLAFDILSRLGLRDDEIAAAQELIRHHLKMYLFAFRRDLSDPKAVQRFTRNCCDVQALNELYVLSYCDVLATSPGAVNEWKLRMLAELHHAAERRVLGQETLLEPVVSSIDRVREGIPAEVMRHAEMVLATSDLSAAFRLLGVHDGVAEVAFVGADAPGLLAKIAAVFARMKVKVVTAQLFSWHAQVDPTKTDAVRVMDVFTVQTGFDEERLERECKQYEREFAKIQDDSTAASEYGAAIRYVESGLTDARWSPREAPTIPIRVRFDNKDASHHTILEVVTNDRADILFWIADTLHRMGLTIDSAKVHVEGARVTDVFYLRCPQTGKVDDPTRLSEMKQELTAVLRRVLSA